MSRYGGRVLVFVITYLAYMSVHIVRKPSSVLKSVLHPQDSYDEYYKPGWPPFNQDLVPSRVAEVGLRVSSAGNEAENGLYECFPPHENGKACYVFRQSNDGPLVVQRRTKSFCQRLIDAGYSKDWCWTLEVYSSDPSPRRAVPPLYAQMHDGELPKSLHASDVDLERKAWRQCIAPQRCEPLTDMRVRPDVQDGKVLLGMMDTVFLLAYTVGLFVSGFIADRVDIRKFLTIGMVSAGLSSVFLGLAHRFKVHSLMYFLVISAWGGLSQSVGWPCVVTVMGRWFPRTYRRRGLIMGAWSTNLFIGNILGSVIATAAVGWGMRGEDWPLGFEIPGWIVVICGLLVFALLDVAPHGTAVGHGNGFEEASDLTEPLADITDAEDAVDLDRPAPTLLRALMIPGVIPFSLCLCFAKMAQYALLFWGPYYLQVVGFSSERAGYLCSFFDVGALLGSIASGWISDKLGGRRGLTAALFLIAAAVSLFAYYHATAGAGEDVPLNIAMMVLAGFWVNGPVSLITTSVSQELGSHPSLNGDERLIASVTGIIDGTGSFGAAMQGILIGVMSTSSWERVFQFLVVCCLLSASLLAGIVKRELLASNAQY